MNKVASTKIFTRIWQLSVNSPGFDLLPHGFRSDAWSNEAGYRMEYLMSVNLPVAEMQRS